MAWIESHQSLERHPKRADLSGRMQWSKPETIGRLHMLWWWVLDFAEDGDLRKYNDGHIAEAMCVDVAQSRILVEALVQARWLERKPYFRVRNWYGYVWRFLHVKYGKTDVARIRQIKAAYADSEPEKDPENIEEQSADPVTAPLTAPVTALTNQPTNQPGGRARARVESSVPTTLDNQIPPIQRKEGWQLRKDLRESTDPAEREAINAELKRRAQVNRKPPAPKPEQPAKPKPEPIPFEKRKQLWEQAKQNQQSK